MADSIKTAQVTEAFNTLFSALQVANLIGPLEETDPFPYKPLSFYGPHLSDGALVKHTLEGDMNAFDALVQRYSKRLLRFIANNLKPSGQEDQAYDVLQHVLLQLYLTLPTLTGDISLKPWLFRVAHNRCVDEIRRYYRRRVFLQSELEQGLEQEDTSPFALLPDGAPLPEDIAEQHDLERCVQAAIDALPPKFRQVVSLRYTQQFNFKEIGQMLNISGATAKTYFHRARPLLQAILKNELASLPFKVPSYEL